MTKNEIATILDKLSKHFMVPEIWQGDAWEVSANHGETHIVPADIVGTIGNVTGDDLQQYVEGLIDVDDDDQPAATLRRNVWFARLSAPGYMDCTDTAIFDTQAEAEAYLAETYGDDIELDDN